MQSGTGTRPLRDSLFVIPMCSYVPYHIDYLSSNSVCIYIRAALLLVRKMYSKKHIYVINVRSFYETDIISRNNLTVYWHSVFDGQVSSNYH
jgi:hypothetical protein